MTTVSIPALQTKDYGYTDIGNSFKRFSEDNKMLVASPCRVCVLGSSCLAGGSAIPPKLLLQTDAQHHFPSVGGTINTYNDVLPPVASLHRSFVETSPTTSNGLFECRVVALVSTKLGPELNPSTPPTKSEHTGRIIIQTPVNTVPPLFYFACLGLRTPPIPGNEHAWQNVQIERVRRFFFWIDGHEMPIDMVPSGLFLFLSTRSHYLL
ncbi:hypothetical protein EDD22DRAFT_842719 [Suillus occidentalis]|nr:hypothetical protein EDD22DRAFT_842719 [Suillus occidentalis]